MPEHPENENGEQPTSWPRVQRRQFVLTAGAIVGVLTGCIEENASKEPDDGTSKSDPEEPAEPFPLDAEPPGGDAPLEETHPGLRIVSTDPPVGEAATREPYTRDITPFETHFVVNHYETPLLDAEGWMIDLVRLPDGSTGSTSISMRELREEYPTETITHTMQCSGNGRAYFEPEIEGYSLSFGALGTAEWIGTPVRAVLDAYDIEGDWLTVAGADNPSSEPKFARSIPVWKARDDCLLAYGMNGNPLPRAHGYPVRLVVPGWFGNNSVKWVDEIVVADTMTIGDDWAEYLEWQQNWYRVLTEGETADHHADIELFDTWEAIKARADSEIEYAPYMYDQVVKSTIGTPKDGATLTDGTTIEVVGVAWAGDEAIDRVEVSTDSGKTWANADLVGPDRGSAVWRRFQYRWNADPGDHHLVSRAVDTRDRTQPRSIAAPEAGLAAIGEDTYPWNERGYGSNAFLPLGVHVSVE